RSAGDPLFGREDTPEAPESLVVGLPRATPRVQRSLPTGHASRTTKPRADIAEMRSALQYRPDNTGDSRTLGRPKRRGPRSPAHERPADPTGEASSRSAGVRPGAHERRRAV